MRIAIVAHLNRVTQAEALADNTGAAHITYDDGSLGCEGNHRRAWEWHAEHTPDSWAVVLEDDALPVPEFSTQLRQALAEAPSPVVSLYLGRQRPPHWQGRIRQATQDADQADACFITSTYLLHAVGVAVRADLIPDLLSVHSNYPADQHLSWWARDREHLVSYTWPSLVDHADLPTLTKHSDEAPRDPGRVAWCTGTRDKWTPTTVHMQAP